MGIFGRSDHSSEKLVQTSEATTISSGAKIEGNFSLSSKLNIDGEVTGQIYSTSTIFIGKNGTVKADLKAETLIIGGVFEGTAECDTIEVLNSGNLIGNVVVKDLIIEAGGNFEGQSTRKKAKTQPQLESKSSKKE